MALFTDGPASNIEDLTAQDSQLLNVANAESIDVTMKLALAHEAVGIELEELLGRGEGLSIGHVVVTPPLRLWHTYRTLESVYRDAYNNQLNDRYGGKRDQFKGLATWAFDRLRRAGAGMARRPVPRAATPELEDTAGSLPNGTYYVSAAWVNVAGEEGAPATPAVITAAGTGFLARLSGAPAAANGWNVYVGTAPEALARQNEAPLAPDAPWMQSDPMITGSSPTGGQMPNYLHPIPRVIQRG